MKRYVFPFFLLSIVLIAVVPINCVQKAPTAVVTPVPSSSVSSPAPSPSQMTPSAIVSTAPGHDNFTYDEKVVIGNLAMDNPYVQKRAIKVGWRDIADVPIKLLDVRYMTDHEVAPGYDTTRTLPAAEIIVGNASQAGIDVVAFVDMATSRVAYVGFVARPGADATGATYHSADRGVAESVPGESTDRIYENVTILDTGYIQDQNLSDDEISTIQGIALANDTVKGKLQGHSYQVRNVTVTAVERGYPDRYIEAYPMATIDIMEGKTVLDTIDVFVDVRKNRVASISTEMPYQY